MREQPGPEGLRRRTLVSTGIPGNHLKAAAQELLPKKDGVSAVEKPPRRWRERLAQQLRAHVRSVWTCRVFVPLRVLV